MKKNLSGKQQSRSAKKPDSFNRAHRGEFGPFEILVTGAAGPSGKSTVQQLIGQMLTDLGCSVTMHDTAGGSPRGKVSLHGVASPLRPFHVTIDTRKS